MISNDKIHCFKTVLVFDYFNNSKGNEIIRLLLLEQRAEL